MGRDWRFAVTPANGGSSTEVPWATARVGWVLSNPGYIEVDLLPSMVSDLWTPGNHRLEACEGGVGLANRWQLCDLEHLSRSGGPDDPRYTASAIGVEARFEKRIVHHEWAGRMTRIEHLETLMEDLQVLQGGGDMGFSNSVDGTTGGDIMASSCLGVVAADFINDLAGRGNGFDWDVDIYQDPPVLTCYVPQRGGPIPIHTLTEANCQDLNIELDTQDLLTTVTALGEKSDPWGPRHNLARTSMGDVYGRREVVFDTDHGGNGTAEEIRDELYEAAKEELQRRSGARLQVTATFIDGHEDAPWTLGDVWLGDAVTLDLPSWFGGTIEGRCTEFNIELEPGSLAPTGEGVPGLEVLTYVFDALVEDITEGAESS